MAISTTAMTSSSLSARAIRLAWLAVGCVAALAGCAVAQHVRLETPGPYDRSNVVRAIPDGFPALASSEIESAGAGEEFAYRVTFTRQEPAEVVVARLHSVEGWRASAVSTLDHIELLHYDARGLVDYIASFRLAEDESLTTVVAEFSPLPLKLAPPRQQ